MLNEVQTKGKIFMKNNVFWTKQEKHNNNKTKKAYIKIHARAGNRTRELSHRSLRRYLYTRDNCTYRRSASYLTVYTL